MTARRPPLPMPERSQVLAEQYARTGGAGRPEELPAVAGSGRRASAVASPTAVGRTRRSSTKSAGLALCNALRRYDPRLGRFDVSARSPIVGEVRHLLRGSAWPVHVSRAVQERSRLAALVSDELREQPGGDPSAAMVAQGACLDVADIRVAVGLRRDPARLEDLGDRHLCSDDDGVDALTARVDLARAISHLGPDQRHLLALR